MMLNYKEHNTKEILRDCLTKLAHNSHLITDQVLDNLDEFLSNLNISKFVSKFGEITECLGYGVFGCVFELPNNKILKITFDFVEAPFLYEYCVKNKTEGFVEVDNVYRIQFGNTEAYIIVRDALEVLSYEDTAHVIFDLKRGIEKEYTGTSKEVYDALKVMYDMDSTWRGTHSENLAIQNGNVVLYDGFSKNVRLDINSIPELSI